MTKKCLFCGRFFAPDHRIKDRQKSCSNPDCKKKRKKASQDAWVKKNPGYFAGRYPYVKIWREKKAMIQDVISQTKRPQKLIFIVPDDMIQMMQDKMLFTRSGKRTFTVHGYG